jgi:hypothetical protein
VVIGGARLRVPARLRSTRKRYAQSLSEPMPLTPMRKEAGSPGGHHLEEQPWLGRIGRDHLIRKPQKPASSPASYASCDGPCCSSSQHPSRSRRPVRTSRARRVLLETGIPVHDCDDKDYAPHPPAGPVRLVDSSAHASSQSRGDHCPFPRSVGVLPDTRARRSSRVPPPCPSLLL